MRGGNGVSASCGGGEVGCGGGGRTTFGADWLACSKAFAKACTLPKRCFGSLARAVITTCSTSCETPDDFSHNDGGDANMCCAQSSVNEPWKGRSPQSHS